MVSYSFLLDFFPLVEEIMAENPILGSAMIAEVLDSIKHQRIETLLLLSRDLGYLSPDVLKFLLRELRTQ